MLLHDAERQSIQLKVETHQVENLHNVKEMQDFIRGVTSMSLPSQTGKNSIASKLQSISSTQNLISDYQSLKEEFEFLTEKYGILKNQNDMLVKENQNLTKSKSDEVSIVNKQLKVF